MTDFLTADSNLPSYMMFPRFLLDMEINETAKMLYIILLDRARLSQKNEGWSDIAGHVFIYFTIEALAEVLHKSQMTVKTALAVLEKQELIFRKRQGPGPVSYTHLDVYKRQHFKRAFKIYEKIWADEPEMIEAKYQEIQELYPQRCV